MRRWTAMRTATEQLDFRSAASQERPNDWFAGVAVHYLVTVALWRLGGYEIVDPRLMQSSPTRQHPSYWTR